MTLKVVVRDEIGVAPDMLRQAQEEAARIFATAGVRVVWSGGRPTNERHLVIKIASKPAARQARHIGVLGIAAGTEKGTGTFAWVFYDRILEQADVHKMDVATLLGHVMAHEMGHLLLGFGGHMINGIMKAGWDVMQASLAASGSLNFGSDQAAKIRKHLSRAHSTMAAR